MTRLGPLVIKRYACHRHVPDAPPSLRVAREAAGAAALRSRHLAVATPLWSCPRLHFMIRRWHSGLHPQPPSGLTEVEVRSVGAWIGELRGAGERVLLPGGNHAGLSAALRRLEAVHVRVPDVDQLLAARDLVHGDLRPGNVIRTERGLVIIDTEAVSVGSIVWDVAHVVGLLLGPGHPLIQLLFRTVDLAPNEERCAVTLAGRLAAENTCAR